MPGHQAACRALGRAAHQGHGLWDSDCCLPQAPPHSPPRPIVGRPPAPPQHACTHVQKGTHMLISGSPQCKRLGVGGLSTQNPGCCQNPLESCPPQAPISGCGGHISRCGYPPPPNSLTLSRLLFHNLSQRLELGDCSPCLPPGPPPTGAELLLPPSMGRDRGVHLGGVLSPEHWGLTLEWVNVW